MEKQIFWSVILEDSWTQSSLWSRSGGDLKIIAISKPAHFDEHNMIEVVDSCLSDAITSFPEDEKEPSKTVFGVPSHWVKDGSIEKSHLEKIRQVCSKLSLSPTGFVVLSEAVAHSVKVQEGSPITGVILNLSTNFVAVSVFKLGNLVGTVNVGRSISLFDDVLEGLSRFEMKEPLPTRFVLVGSDQEDVEERKQDLIKADWTDLGEHRLTFLHTPQFEVIDAEKKALAVSIAGASEMGEVSNVDYVGKNIAEVSDTPAIQDSDNNIAQSHDLSPADIGFVIDEDIANVDQPDTKETLIHEKENMDEEDMPETAVPETKKSLLPFSMPSFSSKKKLSKQEKTPEPAISKPRGNVLKKFGSFNKPKIIFSMFIGILLIAGISLGVAWWYLPKAEVVIYVSPKRLEADEAITLVENQDEVNIDELVFKATALSLEISETKEKSATGAITVGEKASGRITVRNGTSDPVQLQVGDEIVGPNNLEFVITESASVSAALSTVEPGQATVTAEAADIGAEYNIAKDEQLKVDGYSSSEVDAIVNESFSGGSSRDIVAISQADLDTLESELIAELKRKGISQLEDQVSGGRFIPESVDTEVTETDFSGSVGEEASSVSLTLTVQVTGISIDDSTVENLTQKLLSEQVPNGFSLRTEQVGADFELVDEVDDGVYDFDVTLSANLLPEINIDDIRANIKGTYPPQAEEFLSSIQGFSKAEVSLAPRFPGRLGVIPRIDKNISIEIQAER